MDSPVEPGNDGVVVGRLGEAQFNFTCHSARSEAEMRKVERLKADLERAHNLSAFRICGLSALCGMTGIGESSLAPVIPTRPLGRPVTCLVGSAKNRLLRIKTSTTRHLHRAGLACVGVTKGMRSQPHPHQPRFAVPRSDDLPHDKPQPPLATRRKERQKSSL